MRERPKVRRKIHLGPCNGCGAMEHEARGLCLKCYDHARATASRLGLTVGKYLQANPAHSTPGRYGQLPYKHSKSGHRGCYPDPSGRWRSQIRHKGRAYYLGRYQSVEEAKQAYERARERIQAGLPPTPPAASTPEEQ